ncbi:MAG: hypothetical protein AAF677_07260 [Pseudomonadota bacterium]
MLRRVMSALVAAVLAAGWAGTASAAGDYARAEKVGKPDLSLLCPKDSRWSPLGGGTCFSCPRGGLMVGGRCNRMLPGKKTVARLAYTRTKPSQWLCRPGTFKLKGTRDCYRCPRGHLHNPLLSPRQRGVCFTLPKASDYAATALPAPNIADLAKPSTWAVGVLTSGCTGYGPGAILSPADGGSCWQCPAGHPVRTRQLIKSPRACASRVCGGEGERPCYWRERRPACDDGLSRDFFENECRQRAKLSCRPLLGAVAKMREASIAAKRAGKTLSQGALDKIPGLKPVMSFVRRTIEDAQAQVGKVADALPMDRALADLDRLFPTPQAVADAERIMTGMADSQEALVAAILDADRVCQGDLSQVERILGDIIVAEGPRRTDWADLLPSLVGAAHASTPQQGLGAGFTVSTSVALPIYGVNVPVTLGIEANVRANQNDEPEGALFFSIGLDVLLLPPPSPFQSSVGLYGAVLPPVRRDCPSVGGQLTIANTGGLSFNCGGVSSVYALLPRPGVKVKLIGTDVLKQALPGGVGQIAAPETAYRPTPAYDGAELGLEIGANIGVQLLGRDTTPALPN